MQPHQDKPTQAKDEVAETSASLDIDTTHEASATTAPTPAAVPSSNPPVSDPAPNPSENLQLINVQPGPLPSTSAAGTPTSTAAKTSHHQATKSSKKTPKARPGREPDFSKHPPKGLSREDQKDYRDTYKSKSSRPQALFESG
jgi:hypothetical protein